ncbi:MAG: extracellular solute-binding protein [Oscillospiraceae bacterium]|nr:extracellular solute-binding protein [Oscillospiraceae bacterium]
MKRTFALLLALVMLAALFAGCGSSGETPAASASENAAAEDAAPVGATAPGEDAAAVGEDGSSEDAAPAEGLHTEIVEVVEAEPLEGEISTRTDPEYAELYEAWYEAAKDSIAQMPGMERTFDDNGTEISIRGIPYDYPVEGNPTVSIWAVITGNHNGVINDYSDYRSYAHAQEASGVTVDWTSVSGMAAEEQLNLMLASGDLTDLIAGIGMSYRGTVTDLYDQGLIEDITDVVDEYCPNYSAWVDSDPKYQKFFRDDEGHSFGWYDFYNAMTPEGWFVRTDKLEKWGVDMPQTIEEYEDCFARMVDEGSRACVQANSGTFYTVLASSFDIATLDGAALYVNDGKVDSSWYSDNAKEYVKTMKEWHDKGYIYGDILAVTQDRNDSTDRELNFTGGDYFMFSDQAGHYGDFFNYDLPEGWAVSGGYTPVLNKGDKTHFDAPDMMHGFIVLSTSCEDVESAARFMDWFYTDEGIMTSNYGPNGESWYWTPEGEIVFTDLVWNDPNYGASTAIGFYQTTGRFVSVYEPWLNALFAGSTVPIETQAVWATDGDDAMLLPTDYLHLTTEESDTVNATLSDLQTYAVEHISSMILGNEDIDAGWDSLVDTLEGMGLQDIIAQYDAAYQRYLAR